MSTVLKQTCARRRSHQHKYKSVEQPGTTPGQIIITNTKFQRDSLAQSLPRVKFPQPVPNPLYSPSASQGTDDTHALAPPAKRAKQAKGSGGKPRDMYQVTHLTEVPTRLETVVKLSGSTCYRAIMIQDACGFLSGRITSRPSSTAK